MTWDSSISIAERRDVDDVAGFAQQVADDLRGSGSMNVTVSVTRGEADPDVNDLIHLLRTAHAALTVASDRQQADQDDIWLGEMMEKIDLMLMTHEEGKRPFERCGRCEIKKLAKEIEQDADWVPTCEDCREAHNQ